MREAKKRNPNICLDVLQWGAPDWIGDKDVPDSGDASALAWDKRIPRNRKKFFTQDNADYIAGFINGARKYHGLDINYCGVWNETVARRALDQVAAQDARPSGAVRGRDHRCAIPQAWRIAEFWRRTPS